MRILQWNEAEASATAAEVPCGDRTCDRVTLVPTAAACEEFPFARYELWFGREDLLLGRVVLYGDEERPLETVRCDGYRPLGRFQTPRSCTIEHGGTAARVVITLDTVAYDPGLADDLFTVSGLEQGG